MFRKPVKPDPIEMALDHARHAVAGGDPLPLLLLCTRAERAEIAAIAGLPDAEPLSLARALRPLLVEGADVPHALPALLTALRVRKLSALGDTSPIARGFTRPAPRRGSWVGRLLGRGTTLLDEAVGVVPGVEERLAGMQRCNVLLAGRSGAGKSTLVNAVFGRVVAQAGEGAPVSTAATWYCHPCAPLRLADTRGLEPGAYRETREAVEAELARLASLAEEDRLHLAWLCIDAAGERVEPADIDLARLLAAQGVPVIVVLTKAWGEDRLSDSVRSLIPEARAVLRVVAAPRLFPSGARVEARGLEALVEATVAALPEGRRAAAAAANLVSLAPKIAEAEAAVNAHAKVAAALAATPIPFADAALIFGVQAKMIVDVTVRMGTPAEEMPLKAVTAALLGPAAAGMGGRVAARAIGTLLKFIPGLGSVAGGAVNAAVAYGLTMALGQAYLAFLRDRWAVLRAPPSLQEVVAFLGRFRG
ncbi:50S ribosome-binding GTPase [Roseomonas sp. SSH11]|uniref:50S ribosome-binding GTPase n=1 Tax=Pararoseomonas baculiformis TaxID=2820812 RepID=A0ABS4A8W5_9PROT|nr:GTPase [Pararoseomonas baculiformis]MBP0443433.1 50S ribosome-binding GTPase [Pararoseomonas baculiformis]